MAISIDQRSVVRRLRPELAEAEDKDGMALSWGALRLRGGALHRDVRLPVDHLSGVRVPGTLSG